MSDKTRRIIVFAFTALLHVALIFLIAFETEIIYQEPSESARVMKVTDIAEELPPPPPPPKPPEEIEVPKVEEIAEVMIETEVVPVQEVIAAGAIDSENLDDYMPMHLLSVTPKFAEQEILSSLVYPPIALRSGIEGRVILELFVDRYGVIRSITVLREDPEDRGFGEAATKAFTGKKGTPAYANGEPVSCRYRYPVAFRIR